MRALKKGNNRARDDKRRYINATAKETLLVDKAARQLVRDSTQQDLVESVDELAKTVTVTPCAFPVSPQKGSSSKASVAGPAGRPDSSSCSSDSDDMSNHGEGAGGAGDPPAPGI